MSVTSGWGRFTWGQAEWNENTTLKTGWGAQQWSGDGGCPRGAGVQIIDKILKQSADIEPATINVVHPVTSFLQNKTVGFYQHN